LKKYKLLFVFALTSITLLLILGCSRSSEEPVPAPTTYATVAQPSTPTTAAPSAPAITGGVNEKIIAIAETVALESDGLIAVPYVEVLPHQRSSGEVHFGVHYNVFVIKQANEITNVSRAKVRTFVGEIFRLTTEHVLANELTFSHMGVQVFDADTWFFGGHRRGSVRIYIAQKEELLALGSDPPFGYWMEVPTEYPEDVIFSSKLKDLIDNFQEPEPEPQQQDK